MLKPLRRCASYPAMLSGAGGPFQIRLRVMLFTGSCTKEVDLLRTPPSKHIITLSVLSDQKDVCSAPVLSLGGGGRHLPLLWAVERRRTSRLADRQFSASETRDRETSVRETRKCRARQNVHIGQFESQNHFALCIKNVR